ncbi:MAG: tetratricopeptide repeat protein [Chloroflexi bacterium]|nr:tetratricopeptide repeat protein [Chloroflexota bacterium]
MRVAVKLRFQKDDLPFWLLGALILLSAVGFGVYYYYDRYVHPDETILDRQARQFESMVEKNPQNADLRVATAGYYFDGGLIDQALAQCQEALKINPDHQGALLLLGMILQKKGDKDAALSYYMRIVDLNKDNPMAKIDKQLEAVYYQLGTIYNEQSRYADAVDSLQNALQIDSTDSDAYLELGLAYQRQNDHAAALRAFEQAVRFVPDFAEAYQGMVSSYQATGKTPEMNYARAMVLLTQNQPADAAKQLESVVAQNPEFIPAYLGLGLAYEKLGRREQASIALQRYLKANPNDVAANQALGRLNKGN